MSLVRTHFDKEAQHYDMWKQRNWYYYQTIKQFYRSRIPQSTSVLEVGCGTGDILAHIQPRRGVGIDISPAMIVRAKEKHPEFHWYAGTPGEIQRVLQETFDIIFLSDVIEHLEDVEGTLRDLRQFCHPHTRLIINMANPLWEPALLLLEKLHLKMPEGPHHRISVSALYAIAVRQGFLLCIRSSCLLFPMYIPFISAIFRRVEHLPFLRRLCLIEVLEFVLAPISI